MYRRRKMLLDHGAQGPSYMKGSRVYDSMAKDATTTNHGRRPSTNPSFHYYSGLISNYNRLKSHSLNRGVGNVND